MKRLLMLLTTFCLLLMTTALAETEAEWNAKCEWKTGTGTTLYAVTQGTANSFGLVGFRPGRHAACEYLRRHSGAQRQHAQLPPLLERQRHIQRMGGFRRAGVGSALEQQQAKPSGSRAPPAIRPGSPTTLGTA